MAVGAKDATQTDRTMGFEMDTAAEYSIKTPSGGGAINPAVGDLLYWTTNDGTTFQRGDTHLKTASTEAGEGACFLVTGTKNANGYIRGRVLNGGAGAGGFPDVQQQAAITALTFSAVAGTANTTLEALPDPTDTPATADALRDDLVATLLPPLRNNLADLSTKVNEIITKLASAGITL